MGRIWRARDEVLGRDVAIKEITLPQYLPAADRAELRSRTLREARTAARLSHPNVIQIYDVLQVDDRPWIVMEYIRSKSLQQILGRAGALSPQQTAKVGLSVLAALTAAHEAGVLHRDVKPGNVLIASDGRVVLTDFGLATFEENEGSVTRPGLVWGSPEFVAPERAKHGTSSPEADLWSLGATLYAAVEGRSPYARESAMATLTALATEKPPAPVRAGPLKPVLTGLLRRDPRARMRPVEVEKLLAKVADPEGRIRPRLLPRQRNGSPVEAAPAEAVEPQPAVPIPSGSLPDPPTEQIRVAPVAVRRPGWLAWVIASLVVVLLAAATGVALYRAAERRAAAGAQPGPAASVPTNAVPSTAPLPGEDLLPAGWTYFREPNQFRIAVPIGWLVERDGGVVTFREPGTARKLSVETMAAPAEGIYAAVQARDRAWTAGEGPPGYTRDRLAETEMGDAAVNWDYSYNDPKSGPMKVANRFFSMGPRAAGISWTTLSYDFGTSRGFHDLALAEFKLVV